MQSGSRSQYVVEGLIIAALMLVVVVCHIAINEIGAARASASVSRLTFYVAFAAYVLAANVLWSIFCSKYSFYPMSFKLPFMPAGVARGSGWRLSPWADATDGFFIACFVSP